MWLLREGRDALTLSVCQAMFWAGLMISITLTGLIGQTIAPSPALATLPVALLTVANIFLARPISLVMQRRGRRAGFSAGALAGAAGGAICAIGILQADFVIFCLGNIVLGAHQAAAQYYRLAAVDRVAPERRGRAVSLVLAGGIVAALVAPPLALWTKDLLAPIAFAGSFLALAVLSVGLLVPLALLPARQPDIAGSAGPGRPLGVIIRQPVFIAALASAAIGHAVMVLVMHATPLAMVGCGLSVGDAAGTIRVHVLGMFVPSFFTGRLIDRFGAPGIAALGAVILAFSATVSAWDQVLLNFQIGLVLLGLGWNFMYIAGTTLLTQSHRPEERGRVQGFAEMSIAACAAIASFGSAGLLNGLGWKAVNIGALPFLAAALGVTLWYALQSRRGLAPSRA
ncbi:MFS transporter [Skermanella stibiiresistens SB22]|uniref:MFS transporter n=1 Tax=Skermanella stibiiresistens SB22 TaxID=1385369 RepID=W9HBC0_9PROT|nr:MFS transporter [Skermanella stibiiresistens]EWY42041.1 MFS transporter [Skermanella stibiiresistens SB22]